MPCDHDTFFICGEWVAPTSSHRVSVIGAATKQVLGSSPEGMEADVDAAVAAARRAFDDPDGWSTWAPRDRAAVMRRLADALDARSDAIARLVSSENGMPIALSLRLEGAVPSTLLRYYADLVGGAPVEEHRDGLLGRPVLVRREPVGVVAAITPWNAPQTLAAGKYAPALAAGATLVVKPSPETALDAVLFAEACVEAGVPAGVVNVVPAGRGVGAYPVGHPGVDKVAFTGSSAAGRSIAEVCGRLLRPVSLEHRRRSAGSRHGRRSAGERTAARPRRGPHRQGPVRGVAADRRRRSARPPGPRLVRRAHGVRRRRQQAGRRSASTTTRPTPSRRSAG